MSGWAQREAEIQEEQYEFEEEIRRQGKQAVWLTREEIAVVNKHRKKNTQIDGPWGCCGWKGGHSNSCKYYEEESL